MSVLWRGLKEEYTGEKRVKTSEGRNLQKDTSTYCKQRLLKLIMPTKTRESGSTDALADALKFTSGKSSKKDFEPLLRVDSPICPNTTQIRHVNTH